jgi:N-acyl homoserine lactone hydrolase
VTQSAAPRVDRLTLATVTRVPEQHPEYDTFEAFPVHGWVVHHPDGIILFDTGIGMGHAEIDEWYAPDIVPLREALASVRVDVGDVVAVVLSHMHFDHCGQQGTLEAPVYVQAVEHEGSLEPGYTVPEWVDISSSRLRLLHGDDEIMDGVRVLSTPGHTPGHQSLVLEGAGRRVVLAAQCAYHADEVRTGEPRVNNLHDPSWHEAAAGSLRRIGELGPASVQLSHDAEIVTLH